MIKVEGIEVWGFPHAIRGMRNPLNSWDKIDSKYCGAEYVIGKNDLDLMQRLYKAGTEHRKYLRQIFVSMDIVAPEYFWSQFNTYKIGTVSNSCSKMHKIHAKEFTLDDFSHEHLFGEPDKRYANQPIGALQIIIDCLNHWREGYLETKDKEYWWQMIQLLPMSYNQRRTITMNYENVMTIINQRTGHKLDEWRDLIAELRKLPYVNEIRGE